MLFEDATYRKLLWLENEGLQYLTPDNQAFIVGCKSVMEQGNPLPPAALQNIDKLLAVARQAGQTAYDALEAPLTMTKVLLDLSKATALLKPAELSFYNQMFAKVRARKPLSQEEAEALLRIYSDKGF